MFSNTHFMIFFSYLLATLYFTESSDSGVTIAINERWGTKCGHSNISSGTHSLRCEFQPLKRSAILLTDYGALVPNLDLASKHVARGSTRIGSLTH